MMEGRILHILLLLPSNGILFLISCGTSLKYRSQLVLHVTKGSVLIEETVVLCSVVGSGNMKIITKQMLGAHY